LFASFSVFASIRRITTLDVKNDELRVADLLLGHPRTLGRHQTLVVLVSDVKIRTEQMVEQCAYTSVSFGVVRALTFAGALETDHRNGAVLITGIKQDI
jgi:hypothetical protein